MTVAEDPRFAAQLDLDRAARRRRQLKWVCGLLLGVGAVLAVIGTGTAQGLISLGTVLVAAGCGLMVWAAFTAHGLAPRK